MSGAVQRCGAAHWMCSESNWAPLESEGLPLGDGWVLMQSKSVPGKSGARLGLRGQGSLFGVCRDGSLGKLRESQFAAMAYGSWPWLMAQELSILWFFGGRRRVFGKDFCGTQTPQKVSKLLNCPTKCQEVLLQHQARSWDGSNGTLLIGHYSGWGSKLEILRIGWFPFRVLLTPSQRDSLALPCPVLPVAHQVW